MKPAQIHECRELVEPDLLGKMFSHILRDAPQLPVGQAATGRFQRQSTEAAVGTHEVNTKQIDSLVDEQPGRRVLVRHLSTEQFQDTGRRGILETNPSDKFNSTAACDLRGCGLKPTIRDINMAGLDWAVHVPAPVMPFRNHRDRAAAGARAKPAPARAPSDVPVNAIVGHHDVIGKRSEGIMECAMIPPARNPNRVPERLSQKPWRTTNDAPDAQYTGTYPRTPRSSILRAISRHVAVGVMSRVLMF